MTALKKYLKLESPGLWRDAPQDQRRNVVVGFGAASLVLSDPKTDLALSHWSLPAVERRNPGDLPAIYAPGPDAAETLELDDPDMIAALETVQAALATRRPRPGRLRSSLLMMTAIGVLAAAIIWMPGAIVQHTAAVVPAAKRAEIGERALRDVVRLTGTPCAHALGQKAMAEMAERLFGPLDTPILLAVNEGASPALHLPGGVIVLSRGLFDGQNGPQAAAGAALVEQARSTALDPLIPMLTHAGLLATMRLLTTGELPESALTGYGETLLKSAPADLPAPVLIAAFAKAGVPTTPYANAMRANAAGGETGAKEPFNPGKDSAAALNGEEAVLQTLIAQDPFAAAPPPALMGDEAWVSLQAICDG